MGKRSNFKRVERDFYPTPKAAVLPLARFLPRRFNYAEPCCGDGALIRSIGEVSRNSWCILACDISPSAGLKAMDAFDLKRGDMRHVDYIITNPPWDRKILHPMIEHFSAMRPTWLLFDADWIHTKQSASFTPWLRKIVSVGRVKWIPDSKMTGKDNCAWHLFDQTGAFTGQTQFFGRAV